MMTVFSGAGIPQRLGGSGASHGGLGGQSGCEDIGAHFRSYYAPKNRAYGSLYEPVDFGSGGAGSGGGIGKIDTRK